MGFNQQPHLALLFFQRKLRKQIGNPEGEEKPNKKYYDPRACIRSAEESTVKRTLGAEGGVKNGRVFLVVGLREQKHVWRYGKQMDLVVDVFFFFTWFKHMPMWYCTWFKHMQRDIYMYISIYNLQVPPV